MATADALPFVPAADRRENSAEICDCPDIAVIVLLAELIWRSSAPAYLEHLNVIFLPYHSHSGAIGAAATAVQRFFLEANDED